MASLRSRCTYANVMATVAVFIALGGSSYAALTITGRQVRDGSLTGADVKNGSLTGTDVKDRSLRARDFRSGDLPRGAQGLQGVQGPAGSDAQFNGASAGGALNGTYPNPGLANKVVTGANVADNTLTGTNVNESTLGTVPSSDNAAKLGGVPAAQFPQLVSTGGSAGALSAYSYFVNTSTNGTQLPVGQVKLTTNGTPGDIVLCGNVPGTSDQEPYVAYVNGVRSTGTITGSSCATAFNVGAAGDFEFRVRRADIIGVHSGDSVTNKNYQVIAFTSL
ncbi:MAG: hypothetical protein QOC77_2657 [Thermoleophilaceae bacterium]|jgi:hypothetical protein|nr:hypothetical protein [Thermoleophilaceae bacterium]